MFPKLNVCSVSFSALKMAKNDGQQIGFLLHRKKMKPAGPLRPLTQKVFFWNVKFYLVTVSAREMSNKATENTFCKKKGNLFAETSKQFLYINIQFLSEMTTLALLNLSGDFRRDIGACACVFKSNFHFDFFGSQTDGLGKCIFSRFEQKKETFNSVS